MQLPIKLNTAFAYAALRAAPGRATTIGGPLDRPSKGVIQRATQQLVTRSRQCCTDRPYTEEAAALPATVDNGYPHKAS